MAEPNKLNARQEWLLAQESLSAAEILLDHGKTRSAANRAYYAMFHAASAALWLLGAGPFHKHAAVISEFGRLLAAPQLIPRHLHRSLIDAEELRHAADYDPSAPIPSGDAQRQVEAARTFLAVIAQRFKQLLPESKGPDLTP
ncbi:HEPN domain-containing protein [Caldinitratiruptor microaerophilus]|uniref:HEPN domain-containing protein n=1 Tax=Caldinitratiruptor microaerophilus TaxID=671077 RepID=A0AA35G7D7_9FIRM|nr:HEPN domain-containing protein [Caldinitratiruptor microaerophilus]BDG59735.1 hypothetical protein caldi_08250 [Caldinitratiruptor microaerophilus]